VAVWYGAGLTIAENFTNITASLHMKLTQHQICFFFAKALVLVPSSPRFLGSFRW